jgi:ribonuclease P protein component
VTHFGFSDRVRLNKTDDFSSVFNFRRRISGVYLALHYMPNQLDTPRLGVIVAKKIVRRSVERNYIRRVLRELFRQEQHSLSGLDLVARVQKPFGKQNYAAIKAETLQLLCKLPGATPALSGQINGAHPDLVG